MSKELFEAIEEGNEANARELIKGMSPQQLSQVDKDGWTALHWSASKGLSGVCKMIAIRQFEELQIAQRELSEAGIELALVQDRLLQERENFNLKQ